MAWKQFAELMSYHLVSPGLFAPAPSPHPFSLPRLSSWRCTPPVSRDKVTILYAEPFNVAWLKFSVLLLISKVMRQRCVIIENPAPCPPIPHLGTPGPPLDSPSRNVPRKPDKAVINAESLSSDSGHQQVTRNGKVCATGIGWKSTVTAGIDRRLLCSVRLCCVHACLQTCYVIVS